MQIADEFMDEIGKRYTDDFSKEPKYELPVSVKRVLYHKEEYILNLCWRNIPVRKSWPRNPSCFEKL